MTDLLPSSALRVRDALLAAGLPADVRQLPDSARTAPEAAAAVGCEVADIVKSLVFRGADSGAAVLVLVRGSVRVDEARLAESVGEPVERADAGWVREVTGFAIGGIPPLGHRERLQTLVDEGLLERGEVWAAAGTPHAVFPADPRALAAAAGARAVTVAS
jgi:prolyl-tRNA editing enzyme YbaK/EbsC (Cys-tRNA(Pro) deacylase)